MSRIVFAVGAYAGLALLLALAVLVAAAQFLEDWREPDD